MKHTPGPWNAEATRNGKTFEVYFGDAEAGETGAGWCTLSGANQADNARLIAAAPDLLAILRGMASFTDNECADQSMGVYFRDCARNAIATIVGDAA